MNEPTKPTATDWERVKREAAQDAPIEHTAADGPYNPYDAAAVEAYWKEPTTKITPEGAKKAEVDACLSRIYASTDVARTLLQHIQGEAESHPEIYNLLEALDSVLCRIGFTTTVLANRINPQLLGAPDAQEWMPIRHTEATPD